MQKYGKKHKFTQILCFFTENAKIWKKHDLVFIKTYNIIKLEKKHDSSPKTLKVGKKPVAVVAVAAVAVAVVAVAVVALAVLMLWLWLLWLWLWLLWLWLWLWL